MPLALLFVLLSTLPHGVLYVQLTVLIISVTWLTADHALMVMFVILLLRMVNALPITLILPVTIVLGIPPSITLPPVLQKLVHLMAQPPLPHLPVTTVVE